jgi:hypothetical protein
LRHHCCRLDPAGIYFHDLYSEFRVWSRIYLLQQYCLIFGVAFLVQAFLSYVNHDLILSRWNMIIGSTLGLLILPLWRMAYSEVVFSILDPQRVLFLGDSDLARKVAQQLRRQAGMRTEPGRLSRPGPDPEAEAVLGPWRGEPSDVQHAWREVKPHRLIVGLNERRGHARV